MTDEEEFLREIKKKCRADRSPYVPVAYFKHIPNHKRALKKLKRKGWVFLYKAGEAVGISKEGLKALKSLERKT